MPELILYPTSRPDRGEPLQSQSALGSAIQLPRARIWPWLLGTSGAARTTVVSQAFNTPCVIFELISNWPQLGSGGGGLSLLYSTDNAGEVTAGAVVKPSGTPVFEPIDFRSNVVTEADEIPEHIPMVGEGGTVTLPFRLTPKFLIEVAGPIFLKLSLRSSAGEVRVRGIITVFEGTSLEQLANFL